MQHKTIPLLDTQQFSPFFLDYLQQKETLKPFYHRFPEVAAFEAQLSEKKQSFPASHRKTLVQVLKEQYHDLTLSSQTTSNLHSLENDNTFTITTGHQLNILTGPLYFIYKIATVINACRQLCERYPRYRFVPVYWMASEDHDFEEISSLSLYGKTYTWKTDQKGAVGRFSPESLESLIKELPGDTTIFKTAYLKHHSLSDAVRYYVNELFGERGLIVVDADHRALKSELREVILDDLFKHNAKLHVEATNARLRSVGYDPQVHARDINFFYLDGNIRNRIERNGEDFSVVDTSIAFNSSQLKALAEKEPEKFSPNVILRPLYQEIILPNLAYVGGPAEVVYWLQLKAVFDHFKIPFPIVMPRNFALVMSGPMARKFEKTGLTLFDLFKEKNALINQWVKSHSNHRLSLKEEEEKVSAVFSQIGNHAAGVDATLGPLVSAEWKRISKSFEKIEHKLLKAEKRYHSDKLRQIEEVKNVLFPGGGLQERKENFLNFYQQDSLFINRLLTVFDPFDFVFNVVSYPFD